MALLPRRHDWFHQEGARIHTNLDRTGFVNGHILYDATLRNLELISEAATHIPDDMRDAHPEVPWRMIIATRNRLIPRLSWD